jgi:hypothetical protein
MAVVLTTAARLQTVPAVFALLTEKRGVDYRVIYMRVNNVHIYVL